MASALRGPTVGIFLLALLVVGALGFAPSSHAQASDEEAIVDVVTLTMAAASEGDIDAFAAHFTDAGLIAFFDVETVDEALEAAEEELGGFTVEPVDISEITIDGDSASAVVTFVVDGSIPFTERWFFVRVDGEWLINANEVVQPEIPDGYEVVEVDLFEYGFDFDETQINAGDQIAFEATNIGQEEHEMVLARIPLDLDLEEALQSPEPPPGVVDVAFTFASPGETGIAVAENPIEPGRYVMLCFFPAPDGTPHVFLGMLAEFMVEAPATPTATSTQPAPTATATIPAPKPPATGTGTADSDSSTLAVVAALVLLALAAGGTVAARRVTRD